MSTWSGVHPPPPPRLSRSRSPSRGSRAPYTDGYPPQDPYWDSYRDRGWSDYDRDRGSYDYRRGRSRSPAHDDGGRKRRRSPSPYDRDRYDPRPRYNDDYDAHSRGHGYMSPRGRGQYGHQYSSRPSRAPPDPHTFDYPASLKQYAEWFRYYYPQQASEEDIADKAAEQEAGDGSKPRNGIKSRWEKYKKDFNATQLQTLFDHHRKSPWFAEKYSPAPEFENLRARVRKIGWRGKIKRFIADLENGKYDRPADDVDDSSKEGKDETLSGNGVHDGLSAKLEDKDEDGDFGMGVDDDAQDAYQGKMDLNGKGSDGKRVPRSDEVSVNPDGNQVMIRTIPPDIGRVKLENAMKDIPGFVYLALGDPMQKRNYYRAGWIKFTEDTDMPKIVTSLGEKKIEGFKLHVSHSTRPFINKIRQTPDVASRPERIAKDLLQAKKLAAILEEEHERLRQFKPERTEVTTGDDTAMQNGEVKTDPFVDLSPDEDEDLTERGSDAVEKRLSQLFAELPEYSEDGSLEDRKNVIALDMYLSYLRAAFHTCYYCASISDHVEELQRKCIKHARKPLVKRSTEEPGLLDKVEDKDASKDRSGDGKDTKRNDERWLDWLDGKIALLIDKDNIDVREYGGKHMADELTKAVTPHIKQEDEGRYRCKTCGKLFKATAFVEKHIANKHGELVKQLDDLPYFNNFALDPQHIQPFTHPPPVTGNGQAPPPQAYGLQGPPMYSDYARIAPTFGSYPMQYPPPAYGNGGHWEYHPQPGGYPPALPPSRGLRDEPPIAGGPRRLSERISGYPSSDGSSIIHGIEGLPPKPVGALEPSIGSGGGGGGGPRKNSRVTGPPPPPPPDAKEDPRAAAGKKVSYHDMDLVAEGDVELTY